MKKLFFIITVLLVGFIIYQCSYSMSYHQKKYAFLPQVKSIFSQDINALYVDKSGLHIYY